jgi:hypothetical protein
MKTSISPYLRGWSAGPLASLIAIAGVLIGNEISAVCGGSVCSDRFFGLLSGKIVQLVVVVAVGM